MERTCTGHRAVVWTLPTPSDRDSSLGCSRVHIITGINPEDKRMYARFVSEQRNVNAQTWPVEALAGEEIVTKGPDSPEKIWAVQVGQEVLDGAL